MAGIVYLTFDSAEIYGGTFAISVEGGTIVLDPSLSFTGTIPFNVLSIGTGAIGIDAAESAVVNGTFGFPINAPGGAPTITVTNFINGTANINWPTSSGTQSQPLSRGEPIPLAGFQN
jgi:hypothetical protein